MERGGRRYRSKKQRPCDLCRSRKIQCKLQSEGSECELCQRLARPCTFVSGPIGRKRSIEGDAVTTAKRQRTQHQHQSPDTAAHRPEQAARQRETSALGTDLSLDFETSDTLWLSQAGFAESAGLVEDQSFLDRWPASAFADPPASVPPLDDWAMQPSLPEVALDASSTQAIDALSPTRNQSQTLPLTPHPFRTQGWPREYALEGRSGVSNHMIGLSCESDPFLLDQYRYDAHDNYHMHRLDWRRISDGKSAHPLQFMLSDEAIWQDDIRATERQLSGGDGSEAADATLLSGIVNPGQGARLVKLYKRFIHPRFPALSSADLEGLSDDVNNASPNLATPVGLRSAVYALAAPFTFLDDELSVSKGYWQVPTETLWAIANRSFQRASCLSHASLLQLCLLLLHMPPQNWVVAEPVKFWMLTCSAVAIAENLGLNIDPSGWRLPKAEIRLRRRLWWLTYMTHTWHALICGRASHIRDSNWSVSALNESDFDAPSNGSDADDCESSKRQTIICMAHQKLAVIAADVLKAFYTLKSVVERPDLQEILNRAQMLRVQIESWRQTLPLLSTPVSQLSDQDFEEGAALRISHLTLEVMIFRALLRPLVYRASLHSERDQEPISTILENCHVCGKVAADMVSSLQTKHFAGFWSHYFRYKLCYVSGLILLNLAASPTREMAVRSRDLLEKWRNILRIQAKAWPLARLAAMRLDVIFWKGLALAIHGAGPESPALQLLNESQ